MPSKPSIFTTKTAFLSSQTRLLLPLPRLPAQWSQKLPDSDEYGDLSDSVLQQALYKLSIIARKHHNLVYSSQTLRHIAEQIDALYWEAAEGKEGDVAKEVAVLRAGVDLRLRENIDALPESYPKKEGETEEDLEEYQTLRQRLKHCYNLLEGNRAKHAHYERLREALGAFENPVENVQPNLVTRDGRLNEELEKMKMLAVLLTVQVNKAGIGWGGGGKVRQEEQNEGGGDIDEDMEEDETAESNRLKGLLAS